MITNFSTVKVKTKDGYCEYLGVLDDDNNFTIMLNITDRNHPSAFVGRNATFNMCSSKAEKDIISWSNGKGAIVINVDNDTYAFDFDNIFHTKKNPKDRFDLQRKEED